MNKNKPTDFAQALSDFLGNYLPEQRGLQANTILSYADAFTLFLRFCEAELGIRRERLKIADITRDVVQGFMNWLEQIRGCSIGTRNQRRAAISSFFKYLQYKNPGNILMFQQIRSLPYKAEKRLSVEHLSQEAIGEILKQPDLETKDGRRDFAVICLMYESAARVSEITGLCVRDIRFDRSGATVHLLGKGNKARDVPLIESVAMFMKRYLADEASRRPCLRDEPLFCNRSKEKLTRAGIAYILGKYIASTRRTLPDLLPDRVYPHILRHSRAMHWLEAGVDLQYIKDLLGHVDFATTQVYAHLSIERKRKVLESVHPSVALPPSSSWSDDKDLMSWLQSLSLR